MLRICIQLILHILNTKPGVHSWAFDSQLAETSRLQLFIVLNIIHCIKVILKLSGNGNPIFLIILEINIVQSKTSLGKMWLSVQNVYSTLLYSTVQYITVQYSTVQYCCRDHVPQAIESLSPTENLQWRG